MSNLFSGISGRFRGAASKNVSNNLQRTGSDKDKGPTAPPSMPNSSSTSSVGGRSQGMPPSPSTATPPPNDVSDTQQTPQTQSGDVFSAYNIAKPMPMWLNNAHSKHIVKGNFMTLCAKPKTMDMGEWVAHQVVEHYRVLWNFVRMVHGKEDDGSSICNSARCPIMSAGPNHSFTWLNNRQEPVEVPACEYISLMQRWISGKIDNVDIFPTDPTGVSYAQATATTAPTSSTFASGDLGTPGGPNGSPSPIPTGPTSLSTPLSKLAGGPDWIGKPSGFPKEFFDVCQTIFRQMFRVYAHLYWGHFTDFYNLSTEKHLNSCFSHFVLTATTLDLLKFHELEPMQPLIDLFAANGTFPPESKAYQMANLNLGQQLMARSERFQANGHLQ